MDRHKRVPGAKRPLGVSTIMAGGAKGYSGCISVQLMIRNCCPRWGREVAYNAPKLIAAILTGKRSLPMYQPPAYGVSGGPSRRKCHSAENMALVRPQGHVNNRDLLTYQAYFSR